MQVAPKSKCLALASFQLIYTCWASPINLEASHTQGQSQISVGHSHPLYSTNFSLSWWHHWPFSTVQVKTHYLFPSFHWLLIPNNQTYPLYLVSNSFKYLFSSSSTVFPFFFTSYPDSYVQQEITEDSPWTGAANSMYWGPGGEWGRHDSWPHRTSILGKEYRSWTSKQMSKIISNCDMGNK